MGWTSYPLPYGENTDSELKNKLRNGWTDDSREFPYMTVKSSGHGDRVLYGAVKNPDGTVWAAVFLGKTENGEFVYKDMDETVGPCYYDAPAKLLKMLTPTDNKIANAWRDQCWKAIEYKKKANAAAKRIETDLAGKTIRFAEPISYQQIGEVDTFEVVDKKVLVAHASDGGRYRASAPKTWWMLDYVVVEPAAA